MVRSGISRRHFLKGAGSAAALLALGCAPTKDDLMVSVKSLPQMTAAPPVVYPKLPGHKVQAPEYGCIVGMRRPIVYNLPESFRKAGEQVNREAKSVDDLVRAFDTPEFDQTLAPGVKEQLDYYKAALGRDVGIFALIETPRLFQGFPFKQTSEISSRGAIPYLNFYPWSWNRNELRLEVKDIADGKHDDKLARLAKGAAEFGQKHGGFFVTTMEEMNGSWYPWGQHGSFIPAWQHIWQVFEDQGANQYATWVWEVFTPEHQAPRGPTVLSPHRYYPGDKYVDWIGLAAFNRHNSAGDGKRFKSLIEYSYQEMRANHPDKPIMQAETGKTRMGDQPSWLIEAFTSVKNELPGLKAIIYYDNVTANHLVIDDKTLSENSLLVMKEIFKDTYWIMARTG